jgi:hypothetical protein
MALQASFPTLAFSVDVRRSKKDCLSINRDLPTPLSLAVALELA